MNAHIETDLYDLLKNGNINQIVRYYNVIKKSLNNLSFVEVHQNVNEYENVYISIPLYVKNDYLDSYLTDFNNDVYYSSTSEIYNYIDSSFNNAYDKFNKYNINADFSKSELNDLNYKIRIYINKNKDHLYIRLAPYELDVNGKYYNYDDLKKYLIERAISILNRDYFNDLKTNHWISYNEIVNNSDMPTYNDLIAYSNNEYHKVKTLENTTQEING